MVDRQGYVALFPGPITERRSTLAELVEALEQVGVRSSEVRLADASDHTHAMSEAKGRSSGRCGTGNRSSVDIQIVVTS